MKGDCIVKLQEIPTLKVEEFVLVLDPSLHEMGEEVVSVRSTFGRQLLGRYLGEEFDIEQSGAKYRCRVVEVASLNVLVPSVKVEQIDRLQRDDIESHSLSQSGETNLNASRELGYMARENGRFGSYPLHDDFGDEAGPEGREFNDYLS